MRVLMVTDFYEPYVGGVEVHVRTVAHELAQRGHDVAVATLETPLGHAGRSQDGPIAVYEIQHSLSRRGTFTHAERPWAPPAPDPVAMRELRQVVDTFEPDVIHGHDWLARSVLPTRVRQRVPVVTSLHYFTQSCAKKTLYRDGTACAGPRLDRCVPCAAAHYGWARGPAIVAAARLGAAVERRATSTFVAVSDATADGNGLREHAVVIGNPVTTPDQVEDVPDATPNEPFVMFVGDMRPEKGVQVLADALRRHPIDHPLVLVGDHTDDVDLPDDAVLLGRQPNEVVHALWRRAALGVMPSTWPEPFGIVAIEALANGCPIVVSDVGGLGEIAHASCGVRVPPGDSDALGRAINDLLGDPDRLAAMAAAATDRSGAFSVERIVDAIEHEYEQVVRGD